MSPKVGTILCWYNFCLEEIYVYSTCAMALQTDEKNNEMQILNSTLPAATTSIIPYAALSISIEIERIPTQRTRAGIARLEPFEQAARVEQVLASRTALGWQLLVGTDDGVANRTLGVSFHCASHIPAPCAEAIGDAPVL